MSLCIVSIGGHKETTTFFKWLCNTMIKKPELLKSFEDNFMRDKGKLSFRQAMTLFSGMWNEGLQLGILPPKNPLDGIEVDIKIAKVLNSCLTKPFRR